MQKTYSVRKTFLHFDCFASFSFSFSSSNCVKENQSLHIKSKVFQIECVRENTEKFCYDFPIVLSTKSFSVDWKRRANSHPYAIQIQFISTWLHCHKYIFPALNALKTDSLNVLVVVNNFRFDCAVIEGSYFRLDIY